MVIDLKEKQPIGMMPGGVITTMGFQRLIKALREMGEFSPDETVTHIAFDLTGVTFRIEQGRR